MSDSVTITKRSGCGNIHVTICEDMNMVEIRAGKAGTCLNSQCAGIGYVMTAALKCGTPLHFIVESMAETSCPQSLGATGGGKSCCDTIARILRKHIEGKKQ